MYEFCVGESTFNDLPFFKETFCGKFLVNIGCTIGYIFDSA